MITSIPPFLPKILQSQFRFTASEASVVFGIIAGVSALTGNLLGKCGTRRGGGGEGGAGMSVLTGNLLGKCGTRRRGWGVGEGGAGVSLLTGNLLSKCGTRRGVGRAVQECLYSQGTCWVSVELGGGVGGGGGWEVGGRGMGRWGRECIAHI